MGLPTPRRSLEIPRRFEAPAKADPDFLEHLRYEDMPEPEPPWED
jgi:hypothetical protein